ncbi:MAG: UDP-N-acetylmuramoyl-L-alanine--D-glutamate ligase [Proteobacteria bacterium]|nr:UDP-N-acetylmuramoyl-L-alanine--D-glutamate ligase [Pseudomonadota bacterium]
MQIKGKRFLIVGAGISGIKSALFLKNRGGNVFVNDIKPPKDLSEESKILQQKDIPYYFGEHREEFFLNQDYIIVSPGVPHNTDLFKKAGEKGIEIMGEMELASRFISTPIIAITGTNGKTTTTTLIGEILKSAGKKVFVGGNIGTPLIEYADDDSKDLVVLEVSSFQLETISHFHPYGAVLLNITPDHLDRYNGMEGYTEAKMRIFENQESFDFAVINEDDQWIMKYRYGILSEIFTFSTKKEVKRGAYYRDGKIFLRHPLLKNEEIIFSDNIALKGLHNMENVMASVITAIELGVHLDPIRDTLVRFTGLHHRVEFVDEIDGVKFYNDSKGTNVGATEKALAGFNNKVVLILGGRDKGGDYTFLNDEIKRIVKAVIAIGEAKEKIYQQLKDLVPVFKVEEFESAIRTAFKNAEKGEIVLLSPACSSFDMFSSYAERGNRFVDIVRKIKEEVSGKDR